jgi:transposase InsO family protein
MVLSYTGVVVELAPKPASVRLPRRSYVGFPRNQRLLDDQGVTCSMSRRGDCWDNAAMESFFSTLKEERVNRTRYRTRDEARADVFDYIERFYNPRRRHSTLGQVSPDQFEKTRATLGECP